MGGLLDENFVVEGEDAPEPEADEPETEAKAESEDAGAEPKPGAKTPVTPAGSRRSRAREAQEKTLAGISEIRETLTRSNAEFAERLARVNEENIRLRGEVQGALYSRGGYQGGQQEDSGPDPEKLLEEANAALDRRDFDTYQKKFLAASEARAVRAVMPHFERQRQQYAPPQQINPVLQAVMSGYQDVIADPNGVRMSQAQDQVLAAQGLPDGPDRWNRAFTAARSMLGKQTPGQRPTYSTANRQVLSGSPTNGSPVSRGDDGPGIQLTQAERGVAKKFKMSEKQYAKQIAEMHPERIEK